MDFFEKSKSEDNVFFNANKKVFEKLGMSKFININDIPYYFGYHIDQYDGILGRLKASQAANLKNGDVVLDGGCYRGFLSIICALWYNLLNINIKVIGIDLFMDNIKKCKRNARLFHIDNVEFYYADLVTVELKGGVDAQIFYRSLREFIPDPDQPEYMDFYGTSYKDVLNNTLKYLEPNGSIIIYDTEKNLVDACYQFLKNEFNCSLQKLYHGYLLKAEKIY
ncbi:MAG: methyltransferase domain-containing protein [Promethearchaeota archaeon]